MAKPNIQPFSLQQKYILIGMFAVAAALFYCLRNLFFISRLGAAHLDVATFYAAAEAVFSGHASPYNVAVLQIYKTQNLATIYPFLYPPSALPFFWPLAGQDFDFVNFCMLWLNTALITGLIVGLAYWVLHLTKSFWAAVIMIPVLTEGSRGFWATLWYGQINAIIAVMLLVVLWALLRKRHAVAGVLLGMAITVKLYPALLLPWLALRRDWKTVGYTVAVMLGLAISSWLFLPHYLWTDWFSKVVAYGGFGSQPPGLMPVSHYGNINIHGMLMRSFDSALMIQLIAYPLVVALIGFSLYTAWKRPEPLAAHFGVFIWLTLLVSPITWLSHLAYAVFAVAWGLAMAWNRRQYVFFALFAVLYAVILQLTQTDQPIPLWRQNMPCLGLLMLWGMMQYQIWAERKA